MKVKKLLMLLVVALSLTLVSCGKDDTDKPIDQFPSEITPFDLGGKTIRIYTKNAAYYNPDYVNEDDPLRTRADADNTAYWSVVEKTLDSIEARYNCKIVWVDGTASSINNSTWTHLKEVYAANDMYDIITLTGQDFPNLYSADILQPLPDNLLPNEVVELFWGGKDGFQYNAIKHLDKRWGISASNTIFDLTNSRNDTAFPPILYYNVDLLRSAGITKMPGDYFVEGTWSWAVFEEMGRQILENLPGVSPYTDHYYNSGILNFLGTNNTFIYDFYGNMGFYSEKAQAVYNQWNKWYDDGVIKNLIYEGSAAQASVWYDANDFQSGKVVFTAGKLATLIGAWKDVNYAIVPYPFGPASALPNDPTHIDESKYFTNVYSTGDFFSVPKGKDAAKMYQIIAEFFGGLKEYYTLADDEMATIEKFAETLFDIDDTTSVETLKFITRTMNLYINNGAVPTGIFRQAIREHYNKASNYYGQMYTYMLSRRSELDPDNPNNFWKSIFGEPGTSIA